jgi:hypothetical protein
MNLDRSRSRESHCRSGNLVSGHTRMALGNTRMEEEDGILNVKWSLVVRVWGSDTRSIRVWEWPIRVWIWPGVGNTRMSMGNTRMGRLVVFPSCCCAVSVV